MTEASVVAGPVAQSGVSSGERTAGQWGTLWRIGAHRQHRCLPPWISWKTADGCLYGGRSSQTWSSGTSDERGSARCAPGPGWGASCWSDCLCHGGREQRRSSGVERSDVQLACLVGRTSQQTSLPLSCWGWIRSLEWFLMEVHGSPFSPGTPGLSHPYMVKEHCHRKHCRKTHPQVRSGDWGRRTH